MEKNIETKTKALVELTLIDKAYGAKIAKMCLVKYPVLVDQGKALVMLDSKFGKFKQNDNLKSELAVRRVDKLIERRLQKEI